MNISFFSQRLLTIAKYRHGQLLFKKEKLYYYLYVRKLNYHIMYLGDKNVTKIIEYVQNFEYKQSQRIRNETFIKPKNIMRLACGDAMDVLQGMKRWCGVGTENEKFLGIN